jgi:two-component system phosphate regulon sensor histidine kinase PhoR
LQQEPGKTGMSTQDVDQNDRMAKAPEGSSVQVLPWLRFVVGSALLLLPTLVILIVVARLGQISTTALTAMAGLGLVTSIGLGWLNLRDYRTMGRYLDAVSLAKDAVPVPEEGSEAARSINLRIARLHRTWRRRLERQRAQSKISRDMLEAVTDPYLQLDENAIVVSANAAARELFGTRLLGRDIATLARHPDLLGAVAEVLAGGERRRVEFTLRGPVERILEARVTPFGDPGANGSRPIILSFYDITTLKRTDQMRADFIANASHELRTPLSSLIGYLETLRGPAKDDVEAHDRFLAIMQEQALRMGRLVNDLMSLSRIELVEHTRPTEPVSLRGVASHVIDALALKAESRRIKLVLNGPPGEMPVIGDSDQLTQLVQNLVDNAIKYGANDSEVTISLSTVDARAAGLGETDGSGRAVALSVRDRGAGIPREHLPRLTERFYRVDPARSRAVGGTGLGLALVKHITNRHRGRLAIDSEEGRGSTFTVYLPLQETALSGTRPDHRGSSAA